MNLTMGTSFCGGNLIITNCDFAFVRLGSLKTDINLILNRAQKSLGMGKIGIPIVLLIS